MARPVRIIQWGTLGSGGRLRELVTLPVWLILVGRTLRWFCVRWRLTAELALLATLWWGAGSPLAGAVWWAGLNAAGAIVVIAVALRLSGASLRAILTGVSRRRKVRAYWPRAASAARLVLTERGAEPRHARLANVRITAAGVAATCRVGDVGKTAEHVVRERQTLAAVLGCREVIVSQGKHPGIVKLNFAWGDPLVKTIRLSDLPPSTTSDRLVAGLTEAGTPIHVGVDTSLLVVGLAGSGKSSQIWGLLAALVESKIPYRLTVIDPKGGMELRALADSPFTERYAVMPDDIAQALHDTVDDMRARAKALAAAKKRKVTYSERFPLKLVLIDEFLALTSFMNSNLRQRVERDLGLLTTQGRAAGYTGWYATQGSQVDALGRVRTFIPQRICLATDSIDTTVAALGDKARHAARCDRITRRQRGVGYMQDDEARLLVRYRGAYVTDAETELIAQGQLPRKAFGARPVISIATGRQRRAARRDATAEPERVALYRWIGQDGELLYVGISNDPDRRIGEHVEGKPWVEQAVRIDIVDWFENRDLALEAEEAMIVAERPLYNIIHNGNRDDGDPPTLELPA